MDARTFDFVRHRSNTKHANKWKLTFKTAGQCQQHLCLRLSIFLAPLPHDTATAIPTMLHCYIALPRQFLVTRGYAAASAHGREPTLP